MKGMMAAILLLPTAQRPELPYFDWNACPFEGCAYRQWTARESTPVYDTWKENRKTIAQLKDGDKVVATTGVVITYKPGRVRMDRDRPEDKLKRGDLILTYTYRGEGYFAVWFNGTFQKEFDLTFAALPDEKDCRDCVATFIDKGKNVWWAKVRLKSGQTGWVNMNDAHFDGVDRLA
jgi:hypothetical protein